ncbi:acylphosphatase [bacterium]|nr:acylphosphatase [bacterium]MBU4310786.1 acylphosphatase [bacterium]MBU4561537.1 acylphosphatase [bacterium]MCG2676095.1 acylphosphatase [bacterium]MCG2677553.1 acylphosphatase [bacterium]
MSKKDYSDKVGAHAIYKGRVQGVGFRFTAQRYANETGVTGYVKNLWGGQVEIVAEGEKKKVKTFLERIKNGPLSRYIDDVETHYSGYTGAFRDFHIRF